MSYLKLVRYCGIVLLVCVLCSCGKSDIVHQHIINKEDTIYVMNGEGVRYSVTLGPEWKNTGEKTTRSGNTVDNCDPWFTSDRFELTVLVEDIQSSDQASRTWDALKNPRSSEYRGFFGKYGFVKYELPNMIGKVTTMGAWSKNNRIIFIKIIADQSQKEQALVSVKDILSRIEVIQ